MISTLLEIILILPENASIRRESFPRQITVSHTCVITRNLFADRPEPPAKTRDPATKSKRSSR